MRVCQFALNAAYERGIIDKESLKRGAETLQQLENSLYGQTKTSSLNPTQLVEQKALPQPTTIVPAPIAAATAVSPKPQVPATPMVPDQPLVEATLVPLLETLTSPPVSLAAKPPLASPVSPPLLAPSIAKSQPHALDRE